MDAGSLDPTCCPDHVLSRFVFCISLHLRTSGHMVESQTDGKDDRSSQMHESEPRACRPERCSRGDRLLTLDYTNNLTLEGADEMDKEVANLARGDTRLIVMRFCPIADDHPVYQGRARSDM